MEIIYAALLGFIIDLFLGDPSWIIHPVVMMGRAISALEKILRKIFPKTEMGEIMAGLCLAIILPVGTFGISVLVLYLLGLIHPVLRFIMEVIWSWQVLALHGLWSESMNVSRALETKTLDDARKAVGRIVGRDTQNLTKEGVAKAAVETVAENFSDGVMAPLIYLIIGGAPLALAYKAVNTMDSMVGYKNDKYLYFGRCAAKLDDIVNFIPARLSALLLILAAGICRQNMPKAWKIWRRDRFNHASPNSAQTEAVMAGALGVQLAGPAYYFGELYEKPTIGDADRSIGTKDIKRANVMMAAGGVMGLVVFCLIRMVVCLILKV